VVCVNLAVVGLVEEMGVEEATVEELKVVVSAVIVISIILVKNVFTGRGKRAGRGGSCRPWHSHIRRSRRMPQKP
jgi:hypothetical protein